MKYSTKLSNIQLSKNTEMHLKNYYDTLALIVTS